MSKVKLKVIIDMFGGIINAIELEPNDLIELEVTILENSKYGDHVRQEVIVAEGNHKDSIIYSCHDSIPAIPNDINAVFDAAKKYKEQE